MYHRPSRAINAKDMGTSLQFSRGNRGAPSVEVKTDLGNVDDVQDKSSNCGWRHRVSYGGCEVRKKAMEVEQVKAAHNISYAEAVKRVQKAKDGTGPV